MVRPLTDLFSSFGTGQFAGAPPDPSVVGAPEATSVPEIKDTSAQPGILPAVGAPVQGVDPTQALQAITTGLQSVLQLGTAALQVVQQLWQGSGAQQASATGSQAAAAGSQLAGQSAEQKAILGGGATSVFTGAGLMAGVLGKYATTAAITAPFLALPGGQVFLVEATAEAITEALAVVAKTRAELTVHAAEMTQAGTEVEVTSAPKGLSASSMASSGGDMQQLMQLISPVGQLLSGAAQSVSQLAPGAKSLSTVDTVESVESTDSDGESDSLDELRSAIEQGGLGGPGAAFGGGPLAAAMPLAPPTPSKLAGGTPLGSVGANSAETAAVQPAVSSTPTTTSGPGAMPMSGVGAMGGARAAKGSRQDGVPDNLVTSSNGDEVLGPPQGASLPVVGALAHPQATEAPPDKEWTL